MHYAELFDIHKHSVVYNNLNIRLRDIEVLPERKMIRLYTQRTTFFNSLVTNRALDAPLASGLTIRKIYQVGKRIVPLKESEFSNHLGMNGFVETSDGYLIFVKRGKNLSVAKGTLGLSVGASLKTMYGLDDQGRFTGEGLDRAISGEIEDELGLKPEDYEYSRERCIIAGYRDMVEGGKPQLLFYVKAGLDKQTLDAQFKNSLTAKAKSKKEAEELMRRDGEKLEYIHKRDFKHLFIAPDCVIHQKKAFTMVPSSSACVVMLMNYWEAVEAEEI